MSNYTLLIIDPQTDFHEGGALGVIGQPEVEGTGSGGIKDSEKIANLIHENKPRAIFVSLDTHTETHIGHQGFWNPKPPVNSLLKIGENGDVVYQTHEGETIIIKPIETRDNDLDSALDLWSKFYVRKLNTPDEEGNVNFAPIIWPDHCIEEHENHKIHQPLQYALNTSGVPVIYFIKGQNEATEMYSVFEAEIPMNDQSLDEAYIPEDVREKLKKLYRGKFHNKILETSIVSAVDKIDHAYLNTEFNQEIYKELISAMEQGQYLAICGEALSHCVNWSVRDLITHMQKNGKGDLVKQIVLLKDASSIVKLDASFLNNMFASNTIALLDFVKTSGAKVMTIEGFKSMIQPTGGRRRTRNRKSRSKRTKKHLIHKKHKKSKKHARKYSKRI